MPFMGDDVSVAYVLLDVLVAFYFIYSLDVYVSRSYFIQSMDLCKVKGGVLEGEYGGKTLYVCK